MSSVRTAAVTPVRRLQGHFRVPRDKPMSHRFALTAALSKGRSELRNYAPGADSRSTLTCLATLGVDTVCGDTVTLMGRGLRSFRSPAGPLETGNSATAVRMMTGVPAAAQVKRAILAGLHTEGTTPVTEPAGRMVAAAAMPGSVVTLEDVGLNPTRTAQIGVLRKFGAHVDLRERANAGGEPIGIIIVTGDRTGSIHIQPHEVPELIDELPAIAALAAHGGDVRADGATGLRVKESDRITGLVTDLRALGVEPDERPDAIHGCFFETLDRLVA